MKEVLHERTIRLIPILILLTALAVVVPAVAVPPSYESVELIEIGDNWFDVRLTFNESVAWMTGLTETHLIVEVEREGAVTHRDIEAVPSRKAKGSAPTMDVEVQGGLKEQDTVTVSLTATGAGEVYSLDDDATKYYPEPVGRSFTYVLPPEFVNATTNIDGDKIIIEFNKMMADPEGKYNEFNFTIGEEMFAFTEASLDSDNNKKIELTCGREIAFGDVVDVSYVKGTVTSSDGGMLQSFADMKVYNFVPEVPVALYGNTTTDGNTINITFSKEMTDPAGKHDQFTFFVNDAEVGVFKSIGFESVESDDDEVEDDHTTFLLTIDGDAPLIAADDIVNVSYTRGDVRSDDGGKLMSFENLTIKNNVPPSPEVIAAKTSKDGDQVIVTFDKDMMAELAGKYNQFKYRVNDGDEEDFYRIERQEDDNATFVLYNWLQFESTDAVTLTYVRGTVRSDDRGVLQNFTNVSVENVMPPVLLQIDPITAEGAATKTVTLNFTKPVWWESPLLDGYANAIVASVDRDTRVIEKIGPRKYEDASNLLDVTFSGPAIKDGDCVTVRITDCGADKIKETSSEENAMSGGAVVWEEYVVPQTPPVFKEIRFVPECGGTNIKLWFDKQVTWITPLNDTHITVMIDDDLVEFADVARSWGESMTLVLSKPITEEGKVVNVTITDAGAAEIKETVEGVPMTGGMSVEQKYAAPPEFEGIKVTDAEKGEVTLYFSKDVFAQSSLNCYSSYGIYDIRAMIDGEYRDISDINAAEFWEDATDTIVVKLAGPMVTEDQVVEISITASGAEKIKETAGEVSMLGGNTRSVTHTEVTNPVLVKAWTNEFGTAIIAEFDMNIAGLERRYTNSALCLDDTDQWSQFKFVVNDGEEKDFDKKECKVDGDNKKRIVLGISDKDDTIKTGDVVNLTYTPGSIASEDGGLLAAFDERILNKKRPILNDIVVTKVADDGNEVKLLFDEPVYWGEMLVGGLDIKATVAGSARGVVDIENRSVENATDELTATVKGAAITEGQSVAITVTKSGADKILSNDKPLIECTTSTQYKVYHGAPYIEGISLVDHVEREVRLYFSDYVSWEDLVNGTHIIVEVDGEARRVYKVEENASSWMMPIRFDGDIIKVGQMINVTITEEGAEAITSCEYDTPLAPPYKFSTTFTKPTGPVIETAETNEYGNLVYITFDKAIAWASEYGFELYFHEWWSVGFKNAWLENEGRTLVLEVDNEYYHQLWPQMIEPGDEFAISYRNGYIYSDDERGELADFEKHPVENKVTKTFDQIQPLNDGWTLVSTGQWIDSTASEFVNADLVYKYDAATGTFSSATVSDVRPVEALYVKSTGPGWFAATFADFQPISTKTLYAGWNLISVGTYDDANALLSPLRFIQVGQVEGTGITTLVSQGALNRETWDMYLPTLTDYDWEELGWCYLSPEDGYWIYMNGGKDFGVLPGEWGYDLHLAA